MDEPTDLSREPIYNIRSVSEKTGISPETIRAWERRYGFPAPYRNPKGYRLYNDDEIASLSWLRYQTEAGMTIGQAIKLLDQLKSSGQDPTRELSKFTPVVRGEKRSAEELRAALIEELTSIDEEAAHRTLQAAFAQHPLEIALLEVISPALVEIGNQWHDGKIPVAIEHFSSQLCRNYLIQAMDTIKPKDSKGHILTACAPGEWHELGLLILTLLLRDNGWTVTYLGANLSLERFSEVIIQLNPDLVLFSATTSESASSLVRLTEVLDSLPDHRPLIGLGGQAFLLDPTLTNQIPGTFFGPRADDAIRQIEGMLSTTR